MYKNNTLMKTIKYLMLIVGALAFFIGAYNIIFVKIPHQWFGFMSGAFLIWLFFNIDTFLNKKSEPL
jgi:hypothetical protein